jgi:hypothetical protein
VHAGSKITGRPSAIDSFDLVPFFGALGVMMIAQTEHCGEAIWLDTDEPRMMNSVEFGWRSKQKPAGF